MPPKKKTANGKSGKDKPPQKRESVVSEGKDETLSQKSDESKSIGEYEDVGVGGGSRRGSRFDQKKAGGHPLQWPGSREAMPPSWCSIWITLQGGH